MFAAGLDHEDPILASDRGIAGGTPDARASHYHTRSEGQFQLAPAIAAFYEVSYVIAGARSPVGAPTVDGLVVSRDSLYNPYGVDVFAYRPGIEGLDGRSRQTVDTLRASWASAAAFRRRARARRLGLGAVVQLRSQRHHDDRRARARARPARHRGRPELPRRQWCAEVRHAHGAVAGCVPLNVFQRPITLDRRGARLPHDLGRQPGFDELWSVRATAHGTVVALPHRGALSAAWARTPAGNAGHHVGSDGRARRSTTWCDRGRAGHAGCDRGFGALSLVPVRGVAWAESLELDLSARRVA